MERKKLIVLFTVEIWERFSYFALRTLFVYFFINEFNKNESEVFSLYSSFTFFSAIGPLLGGYLADRYWGAKRMVLLGGIIISIGHFTLSFNVDSFFGSLLGMSIIVLGTGFFRGNSCNLIGDIFDKDQEDIQQKIFTLFYVSINVGGILGCIVCGIISKIYGYHIAFSLAGIGMILGLLIFIYNYKIFPKGKLIDKRNKKISVFQSSYITIFYFLFILLIFNKSKELSSFLILSFIPVLFLCWKIYSPVLKKVYISMIICIGFYSLELLGGSLINMFILRHVDKNIFSIQIPASLIQVINPISIILLGPLLVYVFKKIKAPKKLINLKFTWGFITAPLSFFILYLGTFMANNKYEIPLIFQVISFIVIALGELIITPSLQQEIVKNTPNHLRGIVMGLSQYLLAISFVLGIELVKILNLDLHPSLFEYKRGFYHISLGGITIAGLMVLYMNTNVEE